MLNKGLRDDQSIRIDNILKILRSIVFVPKMANEADRINIESQLKSLGLSIQELIDFNENDLIEQLKKSIPDWNNFEQFADFLINFSKKADENSLNFSEKAIAIYNYIQKESKTFSFEIFNKLASANK